MQRPVSLMMVGYLLAMGTTAAAADDASRGLKRVEVPIAGGPALVYEQSQALVIGCSAYTAWPKLGGVTDDIAAVTTALTAQGFGVTSLANPTLAQLRQGLDDFISTHGMAAGNRLMVYFAGHGYTATLGDGRQMGYIVPVDAPDPSKDAVAFRSRALDMRSIETLAERIESRHALFVFDSCFSGSLFALRAANETPAVVAEALAKPVRQFITSGSAKEMVPDQSVFRRLFVRGLEGEADLSGDGWITGTELGAYLFARTVAESRGQQTPQSGKIRNLDLNQGDVVFASAKLKRPIASWQAAGAPAKQATAPAKPEAAQPKPGDVLPEPGSADAPVRIKAVMRDGREQVGVFDPMKRQMALEMKGVKATVPLEPRDVARWEVPPDDPKAKQGSGASEKLPDIGADENIVPFNDASWKNYVPKLSYIGSGEETAKFLTANRTFFTPKDNRVAASAPSVENPLAGATDGDLATAFYMRSSTTGLITLEWERPIVCRGCAVKIFAQNSLGVEVFYRAGTISINGSETAQLAPDKFFLTSHPNGLGRGDILLLRFAERREIKTLALNILAASRDSADYGAGIYEVIFLRP